MDSTRSVRHGQIEVGIIEHNGHEFAAYGATVIRREITAYLKYKCGHVWLEHAPVVGQSDVHLGPGVPQGAGQGRGQVGTDTRLAGRHTVTAGGCRQERDAGGDQ